MANREFLIDPRGLVWDHLSARAVRQPSHEAIVHVAAGEVPYRWHWRPLMDAASSAGRWLASQGVKRGEVCALLIRHHRDFYPLYLGACSIGALPAVLAYPNVRLHPEKFRQGLEGMAARSGLDHILTERDLAATVEPLVRGTRSTIRRVHYPLEATAGTFGDGGHLAPSVAEGSDGACLLQHSSGTTGLQKPVALSHHAVLQHIQRYAGAIQLHAEDRIISWLPLYHDMGLIAGFYLPLLCGVPLVQLSPMEWVASPAMLPQAISSEKGTLCWLPNFAYNFMAERIREEDLAGVRLDTLRLLVNCSEPVRAESHERLYARFAPYGLRRSALGACYAMAETTFAVTQTVPGQEARQLRVERAALANGRVVPSRSGDPSAMRLCVSSGVPLPGCSLRILAEDLHEAPSGRVGDIAVSSESLFTGYRNYPEKTAEVLVDGWYQTGDCGFLHEGECYVVGRKKDLIIVAGNKLAPDDIESAVSAVAGVIAGRVVAFGAEDTQRGTEMLCVVLESGAEAEADRRALRLQVVQAAMAIDVTLSRVYVAPPRWMMKTSSGKLARSSNAQRALAELAWK